MTRIAIVLTLLSALVFTNHAVAAEYKGVTLPDQYDNIYFSEEPIESLKDMDTRILT